MKTRFALLLALGGLVASGPLAAGDGDAQRERLQQSLNKVLEGAEIDSLRPSPLPGLTEVMVGTEVFYMSADGRYVVRGDVYDLEEMANLSDQRRSAARAEALAALPEESYIEFAPDGGAEHVLWVFTDIECGYCRKFHAQMDEINEAGIAVRYLAFPRRGLDSEDYRQTVSVWCAPDRGRALTAAKSGQGIDESECDNPVRSHYELGQAMGLQGTPAVYLENGREIGGFVPAAALKEFFGRAAL